MHILGIESSCDETAAAVVTRNADKSPAILSNKILSQIDEHAEFGGVVPEIAARAHLSAMDHLIKSALNEAGISLDRVDGIAVTAGPGLIGGLMVGIMTAKAISASRKIPFLGINHLEGHALTARLTHNIEFPYLLLLVSGGHSQILKVNGLGDYVRLATTIDDAVGETFDKTAKLLSLGFPGGPNVEKAAANGDPGRFRFTKPLQGQDTLNMSFSGLKTAIRQEAQKLQPLSEQDIADLCASMQKTIAELLADRCSRAIKLHGADADRLVVAGGVAANSEIRTRLEAVASDRDYELIAPPPDLCTDNAAMIAWAGLERFERGERSDLDLSPRSRWPLDEESATMIGSGRKGAKV
ncbi:MAG: tRNA (adenosine(37)-N6)-threonylcarbamoyltransferase complex transferase subunit TsaD [Pseudomonadota bacterium]